MSHAGEVPKKEAPMKYIRWKDVELEREIVVHGGEVLCIPPNLPHEAWAVEDTVDLDVFHPPREDWMNKTDDYLRGAAKR